MFTATESNIERISMDIDLCPDKDDNRSGNKMTASMILNPIGEKRRPPDNDLVEDYQYQLSNATKRIRIDAFF